MGTILNSNLGSKIPAENFEICKLFEKKLKPIDSLDTRDTLDL